MVLNDKYFLNEGLSGRLFHFCPLSALYQIVDHDAFRLSPSSLRPSDEKMSSLPINKTERKTYPYYMCFSRTPSSLAGYVAMRRDKGSNKNWLQTLVRIEVDGDLLSRYYKGMPVNYFTDKKDKKINHYFEYKKKEDPLTGKSEKVPYNTVNGRYGTEYSKRMGVNAIDSNGDIVRKYINRYTPHMDDPESAKGKPRSKVGVDYGVLDRNQMHEYEDRLLSYTEYIKNVHVFIKRIDIYVAPSIVNGSAEFSQDAWYMIRKIKSNANFSNLIHIWTNQADFETMGKTNKEGELDPQEPQENKQNDVSLLPSEVKTIVRYAFIVSYMGNTFPNWQENAINNTRQLVNKLGLYKSADSQFIDNIIKKHISDVEYAGKNFFVFQTKSLKKELEDIAPYKISKYVFPIQNIEKQQKEMYENEIGKRISILSIKANMTKNVPQS